MMRVLGLASVSLSLALMACGPETARRNGNNNNTGKKDAGLTHDLAEEDPNPYPSEDVDLAGIEPSDPPVVVAEDPKTCDEAAANKSYVGCDYWPTAVTNAVLPDFDFTVIVANVGSADATVTVTGPGSVDLMETVPAGTLKKIYLPWVDAINPPAAADREYGVAQPMGASLKSAGAAYHLVSSLPVVVYQFNPLEYKAQGGGPGKQWKMCEAQAGGTADCYSVSNDASLLLPSTAMTGNYRVASSFARGGAGAYFAITATADATTVSIKAAQNMQTLAGGGIAAMKAGDTVTFTMNAGDVVEIVSDPGTPPLQSAPDTRELSGALVQADKPVQVIAGDNCLANPKPQLLDFDPPTCDHVEEIVMPAETLGRKYVVTVPSGPKNQKDTKHTVRIVGNVDGTKLTFTPALSGVATTINAGQVIEIDDSASNFIVEGDHEFAVVNVQKSAKIVDGASSPPDQKGDPSLSSAVAVEQFRKNYVFLAPDDYDTSFVDIVLPKGATITLDGAPIGGTPTAIGSDYDLVRVKLNSTAGGIHSIDSDVPIGIQVIGYGSYTSYQYPGGLNLKLIAPPPEPIG